MPNRLTPDKARKVAFSISFDPEVKEKIEALASIRQVSASQYLEQLAIKEIASVDASTWAMIAAVQKRIKGPDGTTKKKKGEPQG